MAAVALAVLAGLATAHPTAQSAACGITMRILVLSADGQEADLGAITNALDYLGTPYTVYIAANSPGGLTPAFLGDGCRANFQAVIQTTADLVAQGADGNWMSALTAAEQQALAQYEAQYKIRQVTWYTYPTAELGFTGTPAPVDTTGSPLPIALTPAGTAIFPYLVPNSSALAIQDAYTYLAFANDATPVLTDAAGHALAAVEAFGDGRENLALTFDSNQYLLHATVLSYGIVNWATRGVFVGERHISMSPQVDDFFIDDERWTPSMACGTDPETSSVTARMTGADMKAIDAWQSHRNQDPITAGIRLTLAFNGEGTTGIYDNDTLTPTAKSLQSHFHWVSHTYDHDLLDALDYSASQTELTLNNGIAAKLGLSDFSAMNLVTPEISGLTNPDFLSAAVDTGVRYVVSDTSKPGYDNPFPNLGIINPLQPSILMIPRRANNLFYNVVAPADWVAEYNCLYQSYWGTNLTYDQVLSVESSQLLMYLLRGENDPWMFHQPNLIAYDGTHALITDLLDETLDRYKALYNLPIVSPRMDELGAAVAQRMQFHAAHVDAVLQPGVGIIVSADAAVSVPITGAATTTAQSYGGQSVSWVPVPAAGAAVSVPLSSGAPPTPALPAGWSDGDIGSVGAPGSASYDGSASTFTVSGAGADVWGTADTLHYAYQQVSGDTRIVARVATIQNVNAWTKAGVMIRGALTAGAAQGFMLVSPSKGLAFQRRTAANGSSVSTTGAAAASPYWVRLDRIGTTVSAYQSVDGNTWTLVANATIATGTPFFVGLGVSSHVAGTVAAATFDHVSVTAIAAAPPSPATLPDGWSHGDIGSVGTAGAAAYDASSSTFTVSGAGADVWGTADALHFAYQTVSGDTSIVARVAAVENVNAWTKAGVMIRASAAAGAAQGFMLVSPSKGLAFQRRSADGGSSASTTGASAAAPYWVRLDRVGTTVSAYQSIDGTTWKLVDTATIATGASFLAGLAVSSHVAGTAATASFDHVSMTPIGSVPPPPPPPPPPTLPDGWSHGDIGAVGAAGSAAFDSGTSTYTVSGAGADVWGTADALQFASTQVTGDTRIVARIASIQNVAAWTKAGVMIRETLSPGSPQAFMLVSAGKGSAFQRRVSTAGDSTSTTGPAATAPRWVALERDGDLITASISSDGVTWTIVGSDTIAMSASVYVGLAVSSHTTSTAATATFTNVGVITPP